MTALAPSHDSPAPGCPGVDHAEMSAAAVAALQAAIVVVRRPVLAFGSRKVAFAGTNLIKSSHAHLFRKSSCVQRSRCRPLPASWPGALTPQMLAAAVQPTRQSSQWFFVLPAHVFHSAIVLPGPLVLTQQGVTWSGGMSR